jgi:uncharacterized protein YwgA
VSRSVRTDLRCKDVILALSTAGERSISLGRLQLQKLIYLADVLAIAWRYVGTRPGFRPWHNGPYDRDIQNAVDSLAFRGFVEVQGLKFRAPRNAECRYSLTDAGRDLELRLCLQHSFADDRELFAQIAKEIDSRRWDELREIVYAEPTYVCAVSEGQGTALALGSSQENLSWRLIRQLRDASSIQSPNRLSRQTMVQLLFAILDEYRAKAGPFDNPMEQ